MAVRKTMDIIIYIILFAGILIFTYCVIPLIMGGMKKVEQRDETRLRKTSDELANIFITLSARKLKIFSLAAVLAGAILGFVFFKLIGAVIGIVAGSMFPLMMVSFKKNARKAKFSQQLIEAIGVLRSGMQAGLSFNQSIEMVSKDMPRPISDEFSLVVREIEMGVSLDEGLQHLDKRLNLEELKFVISAILIAREVGGDLPAVLNKLMDTLRDRFKLMEHIKTYTVQGRAQGYIISLIPIAFLFIVLRQNPHHFDIMLSSEIGRLLIGAGITLNVVGIFLIIKMSKIKI